MTDISFEPPNLTLCDREPITRLECIQAFGFLLAMSRDWVVARASANLSHFLGIDPNAAIGVPLDTLIDVDTLHDIRNRMVFMRGRQGVERLYKKLLIADRPPFDIAVHYSGSLFVLEGETSRMDDELDANSLVCSMMTRLATRTTMDAYYRDAARQIRALTGFERVMIYRFADSGAGEVIAESLPHGMESFLGLNYPASDIPLQARALYLVNPFRIIADVGAAPVALLPAAAIAVQPLDLSLAMTRAVSPVHIEYLKNMGVGASLSISIIIDGKLWGLIACHSKSAQLLDYSRRTAAELFGHIFSLTLESWLKQSQIDADEEFRALMERITMAVVGRGALLCDATWLQDMVREIIECDGVATMMAGVLRSAGSVPPQAQIEAIADRLNIAPSGRIFATDHLTAFRPEAAGYANDAAGMLAIPMSRQPRDYIMLFRREYVHDIRWAGNPEKSAVPSDSGMRLSPRKSFKAFIESIRGRARPFTARELRLAEALRAALVDVMLQFSSTADEERRKAFERQELLIAELNHRVRNILALIRGLISQTEGNHIDLSSYVESLNGRIQAIARAHDQITKRNWGPGSLAALLEGEIVAYIPEREERFTLIGPAVYLQPLAFSTFSLVIHELVTNSAKYGSLSDNGRVTVTLDRQPGVGLHMKWQELEGPIVKAPLRRGFGSVIIERIVPFDLQGTAEVRYALTGLEADFFIPELHIAAEVRAPISVRLSDMKSEGPAEETPLAGCNVLLLEDNMIIALETEDLLRELGASAVFTASTALTAEQIFKAETLDFALLDINLGRGTSLAFAQLLRASGVPFIFASGYGEQVELGETHETWVMVSKPYNRAILGRAIIRSRENKYSHRKGSPPQTQTDRYPDSVEMGRE